MDRVVYIGGFGAGKGTAERVASALEGYYSGVDSFTFSEAMRDPEMIHKAVEGADAITHSAGLIALSGERPARIDALNAPLPSSKLQLIGRTVIEIVRTHTPGIGIKTLADMPAVGFFDTSLVAELASHPLANFGQLGDISYFNAVIAAVAARQSGIPTSLGYTDGDTYFQLSPEDEAIATRNKVNVRRMSGVHNELVLRPIQTLHRYLEASQAS